MWHVWHSTLSSTWCYIYCKQRNWYILIHVTPNVTSDIIWVWHHTWNQQKNSEILIPVTLCDRCDMCYKRDSICDRYMCGWKAAENGVFWYPKSKFSPCDICVTYDVIWWLHHIWIHQKICDFLIPVTLCDKCDKFLRGHILWQWHIFIDIFNKIPRYIPFIWHDVAMSSKYIKSGL
jgi:hypothetical protein